MKKKNLFFSLFVLFFIFNVELIFTLRQSYQTVIIFCFFYLISQNKILHDKTTHTYRSFFLRTNQIRVRHELKARSIFILSCVYFFLHFLFCPYLCLLMMNSLFILFQQFICMFVSNKFLSFGFIFVVCLVLAGLTFYL